jgi:hypothetical protein
MAAARRRLALSFLLVFLAIALGSTDTTQAAVTKDGSIQVTKNALTLANALVDTGTFTIQAAAYEQSSQPSGIITWSSTKPQDQWHEARRPGSVGAVVLSTGDVSRAIITGGETLPLPPLHPTTFTNSKISNSRDMVVLDMTLMPKYSGYLVTTRRVSVCCIK